MSVNPIGLNSFLSHRFSFEIESESGMNEPISNGFDSNGIFNDLFPILESNLTGYDCSPCCKTMAESFLGTLKSELEKCQFSSFQEAESVIFEYIEVFYNGLHSSPGYKSPEEFERDAA